jgi:outer membrane protein assembly factor BamA
MPWEAIQMKIITSFLLCLALLLAPAVAQRKSQNASGTSLSAYKLIAVKVTGSSRYNDKEMLAASGLQLGQNAADGDFKEAVQRLGDSGMFTDVSYSYFSSSAGVRLEIQLADIDASKLVPVQFDNFVWFTDEELRTTLRHRVPLFKELLPIGGNLSDHVSEALQAMLSEKRFPGRVTFLRNADETTFAINAINYQVEEISIRIQSVEFPGAPPALASPLAAAAHRLVGARYSRPELAAVAKFDLSPVFLRRGYLKVEFAPSVARALPQTASTADAQGPAELLIDAIVSINPGKIYSASGVDWKGNSSVPATELVPLLHLRLGEPADAVRLVQDLETVTRLYRSRGYMMVQVKPNARLDDDKSTVHYEIDVVEGDLFKMGEIQITGLDTQATAHMMAAWTLHEGQPYNADYPKKFLDDTRGLLPRGVRWVYNIHETPDAKDKTVDIEIHFKQD